MNERQQDQAYSFDFHQNAFIFLYALHVALITLVYPARDSHMLFFPEIRFAEYLASLAVFRSQQPQQIDRVPWDDLNPVVRGISVYPELYVEFGMFPCPLFEFQNFLPGSPYEEHPRDKRFLPGTLPGGGYGFFREEYLFAAEPQFGLRSGFLSGPDGEPLRVLCLFRCHTLQLQTKILHDKRPPDLRHAHHTTVRIFRSGSQGYPVQEHPQWLFRIPASPAYQNALLARDIDSAESFESQHVASEDNEISLNKDGENARDRHPWKPRQDPRKFWRPTRPGIF